MYLSYLYSEKHEKTYFEIVFWVLSIQSQWGPNILNLKKGLKGGVKYIKLF